MFGYNDNFYGNGHISAGMMSGNLQPTGHFSSNMFSMFTETGQSCYNQKLEDVNCYPESITSCGSEEHEEQHLGRGYLHYDLQQAPYCKWNMGARPGDCIYQRSSCQVAGNGLPMVRDVYGYPHSVTLSAGDVPYLGDQWDISTSSCCYDKGSRVSEMNFHHFGRESHLSKLRLGNKRSRLKYRGSAGNHD